MNEPAIEDTRGRAAELAQVMLALVGLYLLLAIADLAAHEGLTAEARSATAGPLACVMPGPLSERVVGGEPAPPELIPPIDSAAEAPRGGELQVALARAKARVGELTGGVRYRDVSYAAVDGIADLIGAELHQTSSSSPARLISAEGLVEIVPFSATARRNLRPIALPASTVVVEGRLYVPVRGLDRVLPVQVGWDDARRAWRLACGEREMSVALPEDLFEIEIDRSDRLLTVRYAGEHLVTWSCCVGSGNNTPVGVFHIRNKAVWPPWHAYWGEYMPGGSSRNPLGARWLGTSARGDETGRAIGIHGTNQPASIGRRISGGCVRLTNAHAIEMYETIPIGTRVVIHE